MTDFRSPDSDMDDRNDSMTDPMELEMDMRMSIPTKEQKRLKRSVKGGQGGRTTHLKISSKSKNVRKPRKVPEVGEKTRDRNMKMFRRWAATGRLSVGGGMQPGLE